MGVKDLWGIISPTSELIKLSALCSKRIAIDLSCWICDSQNVNMGMSVIRPHLRNLFFRTISILKAGVLPVFVLDGDAPELKRETIQKRLSQRRPTGSKTQSYKQSGKRCRLNSQLNQCCELLALMGLEWLQAEGEGEATCAMLNYYDVVDAIISQDSDVFLYGGNVVLRNFSGNQQKSTVEKYNASVIEEKLGLCRESLICLALLLGCDYIPSGVPGVGKENALKLLQNWKAKGVENPLKRLRAWPSKMNYNNSANEEVSREMVDVEAAVMKKVLKTSAFPFDDIVAEFLKKIERPKLVVKWNFPQVAKLIKWCIDMLGWKGQYSFDKVVPLATFWIVSYSFPPDVHYLKPVSIIRKGIKLGIATYEVKWESTKELQEEASSIFPSEICVTEPAYLLQQTFSPLIQEYEKGLIGRKQTKKSDKGKDAKGKRVVQRDTIGKVKKASSSEAHYQSAMDDSDILDIVHRTADMKLDSGSFIRPCAIGHIKGEKQHQMEKRTNYTNLLQFRSSLLDASPTSVSKSEKPLYLGGGRKHNFTCNKVCDLSDSEESHKLRQVKRNNSSVINISCNEFADIDSVPNLTSDDRCINLSLSESDLSVYMTYEERKDFPGSFNNKSMPDLKFSHSKVIGNNRTAGMTEFLKSGDANTSVDLFDDTYIEYSNTSASKEVASLSKTANQSILESVPWNESAVKGLNLSSISSSCESINSLDLVAKENNCVNTVDSVMGRGSTSTQRLFETPKFEPLSLAERLKKRYNGKMDKIIDHL